MRLNYTIRQKWGWLYTSACLDITIIECDSSGGEGGAEPGASPCPLLAMISLQSAIAQERWKAGGPYLLYRQILDPTNAQWDPCLDFNKACLSPAARIYSGVNLEHLAGRRDRYPAVRLWFSWLWCLNQTVVPSPSSEIEQFAFTIWNKCLSSIESVCLIYIYIGIKKNIEGEESQLIYFLH